MASAGTDEDAATKGMVCVTGANGFCASWLVMRLLERGYKVRATVRDPDNVAKTSHLRALPGASERLEIVKGDLMQEADFIAAVKGCEGVFHVATPIMFETNDPETEVIKPAVQGTLNVLNACVQSPSIRRVVFTSSVGAIGERGNEVPLDSTLDESSWTSVEFCRKAKVPLWSYLVSKTLAEQAAFEFAKQNGIDLVSINPSLIVGAFLTPEIASSVQAALALVTGDSNVFPFLRRQSYVDVDDVAMAHIFVYENPAAQGRYICSAKDAFIDEVAEILRRRHPELPVVTEFGNLEGHSISYSSQKLLSLGFKYNYNLEDIFDHAIDCCKKRGFLQV